VLRPLEARHLRLRGRQFRAHLEAGKDIKANSTGYMINLDTTGWAKAVPGLGGAGSHPWRGATQPAFAASGTSSSHTRRSGKYTTYPG